MPRPRKRRNVCSMPRFNEFMPQKGEPRPGEEVVLTVDEYESIRLIDKEGFSQEECSEYMNVARTTVQQIYTVARKKIAEALVNGCLLRIQGGDYRLCEGTENYCGCGGCMRHRRCRRMRMEEEGKEKRI